ncbi:MAG: ROK family protein [Desulfobacterales bacterium]|nr:ROK family protein [Desulfobacterales bacterium]
MKCWGGVEAGGTKMVCAVGADPENIAAETTMDTKSPEKTLPEIIDFFKQQWRRVGPLEAIGVGSFGPVDLNRESPTFGSVTTTPKRGWANTDFAGSLKEAFNIPVGWDTDVNAAALAENRWGAARGLDTFVYLTIGTGVGGGGMVNGKLMHGLTHPEMGHIFIPRDPEIDPFPGVCPFHGDCLEGLASGPAIQKRWGKKGAELDRDHPAWDLEAAYLSHALINYICTLSPQRIILGGGVMRRERLFTLIRAKVRDGLNGYIQHPEILSNLDEYIAPPALGGRAGVLGAIALARREAAIENRNAI